MQTSIILAAEHHVCRAATTDIHACSYRFNKPGIESKLAARAAYEAETRRRNSATLRRLHAYVE